VRALSLWEPWATLVRRGLKLYETRDWPMPESLIDQPLGIQAAKHPVDADDCSHAMLWQMRQDDVSGPWAYGCMIAVVHPQKSVRTETLCNGLDSWGLLIPGTTGAFRSISQREFIYGNYEPGRWAWPFTDIRVLPEPLPGRGAQGIFNWPEGDALYPELW
jgi:activating signal cointegrator 1